MSEERWLRRSDRWSRLLLRLYPGDFREEMGQALLQTYRDRYRGAFHRGGLPGLAWIWLRALADSLRNGLGERVRPSVSWRRMGDWGRDSQLTLRRLRRAPLFAAAIVGTLTVGLGIFAVVYAAVDKVLVEPLPYESSDDLYFVWRDYGPVLDLQRGWVGGREVVALQEVGGPIEDAAATDIKSVTLGGGSDGRAQEVALMDATPNLFDLLGVRPELGRGFAPGEIGPDRRPVAVLSHELWRSRFGADPSILGSEIRLDGEPHTVIGVMDRGFQFLQNSSLGPPKQADLYRTFAYHLAEEPPAAGSFAGLIRARPGASPAQVGQAVAAIGRTMDEEVFEGQGVSLYPVSAKEDLVAPVRPALVVLGLAAGLLVIVLLVNLGTVLLVRALQREREFAVSRALGADRVELVRATLFEGGVLGLLGGVGGALAAVWGTRMMVALAPMDLPRRDAIAVDWQVAAVVVGTGALLGLLAGAAPASWAARARLSTMLGAVAVRGSGGGGRLRHGMVVVQVALALVLLSTGGLVLRSFERLLRVDPGFEAAGVLTLRLPISETDYRDDLAMSALHERLERRFAAIPGVRAVGAGSALPLTAAASQVQVSFPGAPGNTGDEDRDQPMIDRIATRPGYFEALGIELLAGRVFDEARPEGVQEAVIDRTLANRFFPSGDPIGATVMYGDEPVTIIGVVEHARQYDVHRDDRPQVYLRSDHYTRRNRNLFWALRTERSPSSLAGDARAAVQQVDPQLAVSDLRSMDQIVADSLRQQRVSAVLISSLSMGALLLAGMGLSGVVAGAVTRRRPELAIRMALGAERDQLLRMVLGEGMRLVLLGLLVGAPGIYLVGRVLRGLLVGVSPLDPLALGAVAVGLVLVGLAACYVPARRVSSLDPAGLLRES